MKTPANILCFDNGGKTFDRYTVVYLQFPENGPYMYSCVGMSENPFSPQGFGQHSSAMCDPDGDNSHLGEPIAFEAMPEDCQKVVQRDLGVK